MKGRGRVEFVSTHTANLQDGAEKNMAQDPLRYSNMDIIPDQNPGLIWFSGKNMEEIQVMEQHTIRFWL